MNDNTMIFNQGGCLSVAIVTLLGLRGFWGPDSFDMPWHLCFFQFLKNILTATVWLHSIQHKLGNNTTLSNMYVHVYVFMFKVYAWLEY